MPDENYGVSLGCDNALGCGDILRERNGRILNDGDRVAVPPQDLIDALPARAVNKTTVDQDNRPCLQTLSFSHDDLLSSVMGALVRTACRHKINVTCLRHFFCHDVPIRLPPNAYAQPCR